MVKVLEARESITYSLLYFKQLRPCGRDCLSYSNLQRAVFGFGCNCYYESSETGLEHEQLRPEIIAVSGKSSL